MSVDAIGATPHKLGKLVRVRGDHFRRLEPVLYVLYAGLVLVCTARRTEYCLYSSRTQYYKYLVKVYTNSILIIFDLPRTSSSSCNPSPWRVKRLIRRTPLLSIG
jgi:hypothetical protein